jgi:hypothetical protein
MDHHSNLTPGVVQGLGWIYLILCAMNIGWTVNMHKSGSPLASVTRWWIYITALFLVGTAHVTHVFSGHDLNHFWFQMPESIKQIVDLGARPEIYFTGSIVALAAMIVLRKWWTKPTVAWILLNASIIFMALSMTDRDFRAIVGKPDNVPIVAMLFLVMFFTWIYFRRAVDNDERIKTGRPLYEVEHQQKVLTWPDLVYTELICMVAWTALLVVWGIVLQAPLEEPASSVKTPNPSKAPWYFLGLQEMLVYYDPWMAGVVLPSIIVVGLMALPYIDFNKRGNGYFSFEERAFAVTTFLFGFIPLWIGLIILGTFLRGPNWNFFGIYEQWDVHKLEVLNNVNLSEYFWTNLLGMKLPTASSNATAVEQILMILYREWLGLVLTAAYLVVLPPLMATTIFRKFFMRMGFLRYMVFANLVLFMMCLPIKMVLRWSFNLKYIVAIPEWFFNI